MAKPEKPSIENRRDGIDRLSRTRRRDLRSELAGTGVERVVDERTNTICHATISGKPRHARTRGLNVLSCFRRNSAAAEAGASYRGVSKKCILN
jgi:hypothetical protein